MTRVLDRNFVLQKQLERSCKRLKREYKTEQRKTQAMAEGCVSFTYQLLYEATMRDKENIRNETKPKNVCQKHFNNIKANNSTFVGNTSLIRPQTANVLHSKKGNGTKRPSSAHPMLPREKLPDDNPSSASNNEQIINEDKNNTKTSDRWSKIKQKLNLDKTKNLKENTMNQNQDGTESSEGENISYKVIDISKRPKTADFFRRKQPESEIAMFWSRKVKSVIAKWDLEDYEEDYIKHDTVEEVSRKSQPLTPLLQQNVLLTDSEKRLKAFVRRFGSKYRTQMKPISTSSALSKGGRKNYTISKQELASIHADMSKRLKNTRMLIIRSGKIQANVERYAEHAAEESGHRNH